MADISGLVSRIPISEYPRLCCMLNEWKWPKEFGEEPTEKNDRDKTSESAVRYMEATVGHKAILRYHHTHSLGKTSKEFDDWWDSEIENALYEIQNGVKMYNNSVQRNSDQDSKCRGIVLCAAVGLITGFVLGFAMNLLFTLLF